MKKIVFLLFILIVFFETVAQRQLYYKETTQSLAAFIDHDMDIKDNGGSQAGLIISCSNNLSLKFQSNVEKPVIVYGKESNGIDSIYYLRFIIGRYKGRLYENRKLEILALGFLPLILSVDLAPNERKDYRIYDPDAKVGIDCYSQFSQEAVNLFQKGLYEDAKQQYKLAATCLNNPLDGTVERRIGIIDTILILRSIADESFDLLDYKSARDYYLKIVSYNSDDEYARKRHIESENLHNQVCNRYITTADSYFREHEYADAKRLYEKAIIQNCPRQEWANSKIREIAEIDSARKQKKTVFTYEISRNLPIGFSAGGYKDKKAAGYFTLKTNFAFFNMLRSYPEKALRPEIDISAGANFRPVKNKYSPIWINIGLGYTLLGAYYYDEAGEKILYKGGYIPETFNNKPKIYHAISPEIGLLGKIPLGQKAKVGIVLRYTFQYRFAIKPETQDYIKSTMHGFGTGLCF